MNDEHIIQLYFARDEDAIQATQDKYGPYCSAIAHNILGDPREAEECVNDAWLHCWNAIPPQRPLSLKSYAGRLTRNLAVSRLRARDAKKRGGGQGELALDELGQCVSGQPTPEDALDRRAFQDALDRFLDGLNPRDRALFVGRYWYLCPVKELAARLGMKDSHVTTRLHRLRSRLREHLTKEGLRPDQQTTFRPAGGDGGPACALPGPCS